MLSASHHRFRVTTSIRFRNPLPIGAHGYPNPYSIHLRPQMLHGEEGRKWTPTGGEDRTLGRPAAMLPRPAKRSAAGRGRRAQRAG